MSVKKEASGRRSIQVEVEVPGTPEEVWKAIATGPGVSAWFVPSDIEEREGGAVVDHFGPGMDSTATVTVWDPPRRFAAEGEGLAPGAPGMATEWTVETRAGGVCLVRVVHSLFASNDDWDNQLASVETGWPTFFRVLRLYLTHFRGQSCSSFRLMGFDPVPEAKAWDAFAEALGLSGASAGQRWSAPAGVPALAGIVDHVSEAGQAPLMVLRIDEPAPGTVTLNVFNMGGMVCPYASVYLYGERAAAAVERNEPLWQAWMQQRFPAPAPAMPEA